MTTAPKTETLTRLRAIVRAAGHRAPIARARLNLAAIRERRLAADRWARTLAEVPHTAHFESYLFTRPKTTNPK